jgi:hypothetical protein
VFVWLLFIVFTIAAGLTPYVGYTQLSEEAREHGMKSITGFKVPC